jgi:preprotein translocase subunit YajC
MAAASALTFMPSPPLVPREGGNNMTVFLVQIVFMIAIFYFILIRPQQKQRKQHQEMLRTLSKGDRVLTNGGIIGVIIHATDTELTIRSGENTRLVVDRGHVGRKIEDQGAAS